MDTFLVRKKSELGHNYKYVFYILHISFFFHRYFHAIFYYWWKKMSLWDNEDLITAWSLTNFGRQEVDSVVLFIHFKHFEPNRLTCPHIVLSEFLTFSMIFDEQRLIPKRVFSLEIFINNLAPVGQTLPLWVKWQKHIPHPLFFFCFATNQFFLYLLGEFFPTTYMYDFCNSDTSSIYDELSGSPQMLTLGTHPGHNDQPRGWGAVQRPRAVVIPWGQGWNKKA